MTALGRKKKSGRIWIVGAVVAIGAVLYWGLAGGPSRGVTSGAGLAVSDVDASGNAATVKVLKGSGGRVLLPDGSVRPLELGGGVPLGASIEAGAGSFVQLLTAGNWLVGVDGPGEFVIDQAKTDAARSRHEAEWSVKSGQLRAKPHDQDKAEHVMRIRTARARIEVREGEIGLSVDAAGAGKVWLMKGSARVRWDDGRDLEIPVKSPQEL